MPTFAKFRGGYRVQVAIKGVRESRSFATKAQAQQWAALREAEIRAQADDTLATVKTIGQALTRYAAEVSPKRKGAKWEVLRLAAFERQLPTSLKMSMLTPDILAQWRDGRLHQVSPGTVLRESALLNAVLEVARKEWRWLDKNPLQDVKMPSRPQHRERVIDGLETRKMLRALGYEGKDAAPHTKTQAVAMAFLLALSTGMRAGEISGLTWDRVRGKYVRLDTSKTGVGRNVPLSKVGQRIIKRVAGFDAIKVFGLDAPSLDVLFRRGRAAAGLEGFTFHDARHTAATRLAKKLTMLELCKIFGWRDTKNALVYYNPSIDDLAARLL